MAVHVSTADGLATTVATIFGHEGAAEVVSRGPGSYYVTSWRRHDGHNVEDYIERREGGMMADPVATRRIGRTLLAVYRGERSTNQGGRASQRVVGRRRIDHDSTPHGNLEYRTVSERVAAPACWTVVAGATTGDGRRGLGTVLGRFASESQARAYIAAWSPRFGLLGRAD